ESVLLVLQLPTQAVVELLDVEAGGGNYFFVHLVFVWNTDIIERTLLALFHFALVLELEQEIADAAEAPAMVRGDAIRREARDVSARGVTRILVPNIVRISLAQTRHQQIASDLGDDRRAGNAEAARVAVHDRGVRNGQCTHRATIDHDVIRLHPQAPESAMHRQHARLVDVDGIDLPDRSGAQSEGHGPLAYFGGEAHSLIVGQTVGVIDAGDGAGVGRHYHGARDDW